MPALKTLPSQSLHDVARQARDAYAESILAQAEGAPLDAVAALSIATAAGRTVHQMALHVDILKRRKELVEAHEGRDWDAEMTKLVDDFRDAEKNVALANAAAEQARVACGEARQRSETLLAQRTRLNVDRDRAKNEFRKVMLSTGDLNDWRIINL